MCCDLYWWGEYFTEYSNVAVYHYFSFLKSKLSSVKLFMYLFIYFCHCYYYLLMLLLPIPLLFLLSLLLYSLMNNYVNVLRITILLLFSSSLYYGYYLCY